MLTFYVIVIRVPSVHDRRNDGRGRQSDDSPKTLATLLSMYCVAPACRFAPLA